MSIRAIRGQLSVSFASAMTCIRGDDLASKSQSRAEAQSEDTEPNLRALRFASCLPL